MLIKMSTTELEKYYYYYSSHLMHNKIIQLWVHSTKDNVLLKLRDTEDCICLNRQEVGSLNQTLSTAANIFFQRDLKAQKEKNQNKLLKELEK